MTLHIIKLSVGSESLEHMAAWQKLRLKELKARGAPPELIHVTRMTPKRGDELLQGGSIYWVVKSGIIARQKLLELRPLKKDGVPYCGLVYDATLIPVHWQPRRAFQGWRYLEPKDAPADLKPGEVSEEAMPADMKKELREMGLL